MVEHSLYVAVLLPLTDVAGTFYLANDLPQTTKCFITQYGNSGGTAGRTIVEFYTNNKLTGIVSTIFYIPDSHLV